MYKYIRTAQILGYDKEGLKSSINYLFRYMERYAGLPENSLKITTIEVDRYDNPIRYTADVRYSYGVLNSRLFLYEIPIDKDIPEDFWVKTGDGDIYGQQLKQNMMSVSFHR